MIKEFIHNGFKISIEEMRDILFYEVEKINGRGYMAGNDSCKFSCFIRKMKKRIDKYMLVPEEERNFERDF